MQKKQIILALLAGLSLSGAAQATLIDRGGGLIYDDVLNITWLQDANYAKTSGYDDDGKMTWDQAMAWAANLSYGGYDDWRLPTMSDTGASGCNYAFSGTDCGYNVNTATSELAYMYHVNLGLQSYYNPDVSVDPTWGIFGNGTSNGTNTSSYGQNDVGLIDNLQAHAYWSGLEYAPKTSYAWYFGTDGGQNAYYKTNGYYAWAVRPGDVAVAPPPSGVPEPETLGLLAIGLLGLGLARRRG